MAELEGVGKRLSPKRELNKTKGSVKWKALLPNPELKKGSEKGSLYDVREEVRDGPAPGSGPVGGGQTPYLSYSCVVW